MSKQISIGAVPFLLSMAGVSAVTFELSRDRGISSAAVLPETTVVYAVARGILPRDEVLSEVLSAPARRLPFSSSDES